IAYSLIDYHALNLMNVLHLTSYVLSFFFFFSSSRDHRDLHSFPTRRSSDLQQQFQVARGSEGRADPLQKVLPHAKSQELHRWQSDRKSTRLNSSHGSISYAVFCLKKKKKKK